MSIHSTAPPVGSENIWTMSAVRERLDSKRFAHSAGAACYIISRNALFAQGMQTDYSNAAGQVNTFKIVTIAAGAVLDISLAAPFTLTYTDRAKRPWKPRELQANGVLHYDGTNPTYSTGGDILLAWEPVNREDRSTDFGQAFIPDLWRIELRAAGDPPPAYPDPSPTYALSAAAGETTLGIDNDSIVENFGEISLVARIFAQDGAGNVSRHYDEIQVDFV